MLPHLSVLSHNYIHVKDPGLGDGEHILMLPFRGGPRPSVAAAPFSFAANKKGQTCLLREYNRGPIHYNLYATVLPHIIHHLPALSIALVQSSNLIPTLSIPSSVHPNLWLTVKEAPAPIATKGKERKCKEGMFLGPELKH